MEDVKQQAIKPKKLSGIDRKTRYSILRYIVDCGLDIPVTKNMIDDWTPNNIKRIILGYEGVMVQYHTTQIPHVSTSLRFLSFDGAYEKDLQTIGKEGLQKITPLLTILGFKNNTKSLSMIEEIIICTPNYHEQLIKFDIEPLVKEVSIATKFPRLSYVTAVNGNIKSVFDLFKQHKNFTQDMFTEKYKNTSGLKVLLDTQNTSWWSKTYLRDKKYTYDEKVLRPLFERIETAKRKEENEKMLATANLEKIKTTLTELKGTVYNIKKMATVYEEEHKHIYMYDNQWSYPMRDLEIYAKIADNLTNEEYTSIYAGIKAINFVEIHKAIQILGNDIEYLEMLKYVKEIHDQSVKGEQTANVIDSIKALKDYVQFIHFRYLYVGYQTFVAFLVNNSDKLVKEYWYLLGIEKPKNVRFTSKAVKYVESEISYVDKGMINKIIKQVGEEGSFSIDDNMTVEEEIETTIHLARSMKLYKEKRTFEEMKKGL